MLSFKFSVLFLLLQYRVYSEAVDLWRCNDGQVIAFTFKCDKVNDCKDGSDEWNDHCDAHCDESQFHCTKIAQCVSRDFLCDGFSDCPDDSDESEETCQVTTPAPAYGICPNSDFGCKDGSRCLQRKFVCDDYQDCSDGSDEENCGEKIDIEPSSITTKTEASKNPTHESAEASPKSAKAPKICKKKPYVNACKVFWPTLVLSVKDKLVRKCSRKPHLKQCVKYAPLLALKKPLNNASSKKNNASSKKSKLAKKCKRNPKKKICKKLMVEDASQGLQ